MPPDIRRSTYYPNWDRTLIGLSLGSVLALGSWILHDAMGPTPLTTLLAILGSAFWVLVTTIALTHLSSSLRIENGEIIQTHFSFPGRRVPLSELREVEIARSLFPVTLRFEREKDMSVSGMTYDRLLSFIQDTARDVRIIDSVNSQT